MISALNGKIDATRLCILLVLFNENFVHLVSPCVKVVWKNYHKRDVSFLLGCLTNLCVSRLCITLFINLYYASPLKSRWNTSWRSTATGLPSGLDGMTSAMCAHQRLHTSVSENGYFAWCQLRINFKGINQLQSIIK